MLNFNILFFVSFCLSVCVGQVIENGQCGPVQVVEEFDFEMFAGTWYEVSRYPSDLQTGECVVNRYVTSEANAYTITQTAVNNERQSTVNIQATVDNGGRGVININIEGVPFNNIYVLGTDNTEYALLYSCNNNINNQKQIYSWKLSKFREGLSASANDIINQLISDNIDLEQTHYVTTGQDNNACFYYPVFDQLPANIEMPVPCPENIRGVPDFRTSEYLGRWYETARYPTTDHKGQCNRGNYVPHNRPEFLVVMSFNEVVDETLVYSLGQAVQAEDLSGHFVFTAEYETGVTRTFDYYILATDYSTYSLSYSCVNIEGGRSIVNAWKRSRRTYLTPEAITEIDNAIANTRGITEEYFQPTSQSYDDCFYIPDLAQPQLAPRFRGQCQNITGVEDFDMERYVGWWHELSGYPTLDTDGECRSSRYMPSGTAYRVEETIVRNNSGFINTGFVIAYSNGKFTRGLVGTPFRDVWVLATDYETYSLVYSCINSTSEYKMVWSAIHSKSRDPLSEAAKTAIASVVANHRVLVEQFYVPVDQSDETCFHYPPNSFDKIIIPGQCDTTISGVSNFNATDFAGDWFHIESYEDSRSSSCIGSRFTVDTDTIDVLNYDVRDGQLQTVVGSAKLVSTDDSAKIELIFPVDGSDDATISTTVFVLATDYTSYALAYSCENVNLYERRVRAWKLSRERILSNVGNAVIDAVSEERQELHRPYFKPIVQYATCLKPNSAFVVKSSVIMLLVFTLLQRLL